MFTLIGAGVTTVNQSEKLMTDVLPKQCVFYQTKAEEFDPESNQVTLASGDVVELFYTLKPAAKTVITIKPRQTKIRSFS